MLDKNEYDDLRERYFAAVKTRAGLREKFSMLSAGEETPDRMELLRQTEETERRLEIELRAENARREVKRAAFSAVLVELNQVRRVEILLTQARAEKANIEALIEKYERTLPDDTARAARQLELKRAAEELRAAGIGDATLIRAQLRENGIEI